MPDDNSPGMEGDKYLIGAHKFVRVSSVLDVVHNPGLATWKANVGKAKAEEISGKATTLGTRVHAVCERIANGEVVDDLTEEDGDLAPFAEVFGTWFRENVESVLACEERVWSDTYRYAGTLDLAVVLKDGDRAIVDLKTSNSLNLTYRMQLSAYKLALAESKGIETDRRIIVQMPSRRGGQGPYALRAIDLDEDERHAARDERAWKAALTLYRFCQRHKDFWRS